MKFKFKLLILIVLLLINYDVFAQDFQVGELIPVNTPATVNTKTFNYQNFVYKLCDGSESNSCISFESILNNTKEKQMVRFNILLFDTNKKNIGFMTYCSAKDFSSENTDYAILPSGASPFYVNVTNRYMVDNYKPTDVGYIAIYDDNEFCHIGGYKKYAGLLIEDIMKQSVPKQSNQLSVNPAFMLKIAICVVGVFVAFSIIAFVFRLVRSLILKLFAKIIYRKRNRNRFVKREPVVDLSYTQNSKFNNNNLLDDEVSPSKYNSINNSSNTDSKDGESDLSKFFH